MNIKEFAILLTCAFAALVPAHATDGTTAAVPEGKISYAGEIPIIDDDGRLLIAGNIPAESILAYMCEDKGQIERGVTEQGHKMESVTCTGEAYAGAVCNRPVIEAQTIYDPATGVDRTWQADWYVNFPPGTALVSQVPSPSGCRAIARVCANEARSCFRQAWADWRLCYLGCPFFATPPLPPFVLQCFAGCAANLIGTLAECAAGQPACLADYGCQGAHW